MVLQPDIFTSYQNMLQILNYPYVLYKREETQDLSNLLNCLNNKLPWMMPSYLFEEFWRVSKNIIQYCFLSIVTLDEWELALTFMLCMLYRYMLYGQHPRRYWEPQVHENNWLRGRSAYGIYNAAVLPGRKKLKFRPTTTI